MIINEADTIIIILLGGAALCALGLAELANAQGGRQVIGGRKNIWMSLISVKGLR